MSVLLALLLLAGPTPQPPQAVGAHTTGLLGAERTPSSLASDGRQFLLAWNDRRFIRGEVRVSLVSPQGVLRDPNGTLLGEGYGLVAFGGRRCSEGFTCVSGALCLNATCQFEDGGVSTPNRYLVVRVNGREVTQQLVLPTGELVPADTPTLANIDDGVAYLAGFALVGTSTGFILVWSTSSGALKTVRISLTGQQLDLMPQVLPVNSVDEFAVSPSSNDVLIAYTTRVAGADDLRAIDLNTLTDQLLATNVGQNISLGAAFAQNTWLVKWVSPLLSWRTISSGTPLVIGPLHQVSGAGLYYGGDIAADRTNFVIASVPSEVALFHVSSSGVYTDAGTCLAGPTWTNTDPRLVFANDTETWWAMGSARLFNSVEMSGQLLDSAAQVLEPSHFVASGVVGQRHPAITTTDAGFFAVWAESTQQGDAVMGARFSTEGSLLDAKPIAVSPPDAASFGPYPVIASTGTQLAAAWVDIPVSTAHAVLHLRGLDPVSGAPTASETTVSAQDPDWVALSTFEAGVLVAWVDRATNDRLMAQRFDANLTPLDSTPQTVAIGSTLGDVHIGVDPGGAVIVFSDTPGAFRAVRLSNSGQMLSPDGGIALTTTRAYGDVIALRYLAPDYTLVFDEGGVLHTAQFDPTTLRLHDAITTTLEQARTVQLVRWPGRVGAVAQWSTIAGEVWLGRVSDAGLVDVQRVDSTPMPAEADLAVNGTSALSVYSVVDTSADNARLRARPLLGNALGAACGADFDCASGTCTDGICVIEDIDAGTLELDAGTVDAGTPDEPAKRTYRVGCGCSANAATLTSWCLLALGLLRRRKSKQFRRLHRRWRSTR